MFNVLKLATLLSIAVVPNGTAARRNRLGGVGSVEYAANQEGTGGRT
jgi:hypothetical protein